MTNSDYKQQYEFYKNEVENAVKEQLECFGKDTFKPLYEAMEYSAVGGKRVRGVLLLAASNMLGVDKQKALKFAAAVEMIHASSLIHDDLPCMDNDTMRRGKPCNHVVFGEATALYAGLGLLNTAYELLLDCIGDENDIKAIKCLCNAAGINGVMKGQCLDIYYEGKEQSFDVLKEIHKNKTGKLITACVLIPALLANADEDTFNALKTYGENVGTAFQIIDDVLDVTASAEELGKTPGKDFDSGKNTYVKLFGAVKAKEMAKEHIESAAYALKNIKSDCSFLSETAKYILNRGN